MATRTDELTAQIDTTRTRLDGTLDDIGHRAGPGGLGERVRGAVGGSKDTLTRAGATSRDRAGGALSGAASSAKDVGRQNPLATGLLAFGAGLVVGSILPETPAEHTVAREVQSKAQGPLREQLAGSARQITSQVADRADEAKDHVIEETNAAATEVVDDVRMRKESVAAHASDAADEVRQDVGATAAQVRDGVEETVRHASGA